MSKHTPGKWTDRNWGITGPSAADSHEARWALDTSARRRGEEPLYAVVAQEKPGHHAVATVHGNNQEEVEGNARLISAAPELLEACQSLLSDFRAVYQDGDLEMQPALLQVMRAVDKATGESP